MLSNSLLWYFLIAFLGKKGKMPEKIWHQT